MAIKRADALEVARNANDIRIMLGGIRGFVITRGPKGVYRELVRNRLAFKSRAEAVQAVRRTLTAIKKFAGTIPSEPSHLTDNLTDEQIVQLCENLLERDTVTTYRGARGTMYPWP